MTVSCVVLSLCEQDTVVALQALAKYSAAIYNPEGSITVTVTSPSGQRNQFTVNRNNRLLYQEKQLQEATGTYKLRAEGKGCVFVQVCALPLLMHILKNPINNSSRNEFSFIHPHVILNLYDLIYSMDHRRKLYEFGITWVYCMMTI